MHASFLVLVAYNGDMQIKTFIFPFFCEVALTLMSDSVNRHLSMAALGYIEPKVFYPHLRTCYLRRYSNGFRCVVDICNLDLRRLQFVHLRRNVAMTIIRLSRREVLNNIRPRKLQKQAYKQCVMPVADIFATLPPVVPGVYGRIYALPADIKYPPRLVYSEGKNFPPLFFEYAAVKELNHVCMVCGAYAPYICDTDHCSFRYCSIFCLEVRPDQHRFMLCNK